MRQAQKEEEVKKSRNSAYKLGNSLRKVRDGASGVCTLSQILFSYLAHVVFKIASATLLIFFSPGSCFLLLVASISYQCNHKELLVKDREVQLSGVLPTAR